MLVAAYRTVYHTEGYISEPQSTQHQQQQIPSSLCREQHSAIINERKKDALFLQHTHIEHSFILFRWQAQPQFISIYVVSIWNTSGPAIIASSSVLSYKYTHIQSHKSIELLIELYSLVYECVYSKL